MGQYTLAITLFCWQCIDSSSHIQAFMFFLKYWMSICHISIKQNLFKQCLFSLGKVSNFIDVIFQIHSVENNSFHIPCIH